MTRVRGLEAGVVAYVDAEWLLPDPDEIPALTIQSGEIRFGERSAKLPKDAEPDRAALLVFSSLAGEVADLAGAVTPSATQVTGDGIVAVLVRQALGVDGAESPDRPSTVVDTTGDPDVIVEATRTLDDLGLLVLAGETLGRASDIDVYPDLHSRGLRVVGAGPILSRELPAAPPGGDVPPPVRVDAATPPPAAAWYRWEG
jgi:hypothetical protein